ITGSFGALVVSPNAFTGGASGAVFGVLGATAVLMHQRGLGIWQTGVGAFILINLLLTFIVPGISIGAHLGGLAAGTLLGMAMLRTPPSRRAVIEGVALAVVFALGATLGAVAAAGG
ncbi:MAG: rhomboid family intramembrane serine protease, partial [Actinobacteria bacterium]|nr:rhomboid family intramembrane serine protease [Actinomycetota bacterium]